MIIASSLHEGCQSQDLHNINIWVTWCTKQQILPSPTRLAIWWACICSAVIGKTVAHIDKIQDMLHCINTAACAALYMHESHTTAPKLLN